ncbi:Small GTPase superfamily [Kalmanozyma brasiliensis GHG001]|uniref:Small GTPase superfamily n=1 Tax=Kalmanozyma brasiliensis (strain GHG001) TaxID=1365824 RepID=UPI002867B5CE|nr:Small GTPase superfamily [Kalmanozyma brasiliensis GHG001]KAF6767678.1 Small GTPase superfamily [Kalmanozyma brasiliensis GHG001]
MTLCGLLPGPSAGSSSHQSGRLQRKVLVLGDGASGKTSLLFVLIRHNFPDHYEPTVFENYTHLMHSSKAEVELTLWDTAGQEEFDKLRSLSYADTDVVLLCFDVANSVSLENVESRWIPEIRQHTPQAPIVLIALKCDLRDSSSSEKTLGYSAGVEVAKRIKASRYLECSAKKNRGVEEAFAEVANIAVASRAKRRRLGEGGCTIA